MKYRRQDSFLEDYNKFSEKDKKKVKDMFPLVRKAIEGDSDLRNKFKLKKMQKFSQIWEGHLEINLVFTYSIIFVVDENENICYFRRIGTHEIYKNP